MYVIKNEEKGGVRFLMGYARCLLADNLRCKPTLDPNYQILVAHAFVVLAQDVPDQAVLLGTG